MGAEGALAEGTLDKTPFAHLFVYVVDRALTGELRLVDSGGNVHQAWFEAGRIVKVRPFDDAHRLGALLVEAGDATVVDVEAAAREGGLLGEALMRRTGIAKSAVERALERQLRLRTRALFALPKATSFTFFEGEGPMASWGGQAPEVDALDLLWDGVRLHAASSSRYEGVIAQIDRTPLALRAGAPFDRVTWSAAEQAILAALRGEPRTMGSLVAAGVADAREVAHTAYALAILRWIGGSSATEPVGVGTTAAPPPPRPSC